MTTLLERLKVNEGTKKGKNGLHVAYQDSEFYWTIGYGILIDEKNGGLYEEEAEFLLNNRIKKALKSAQEFSWFSKLNQTRQEVIVEMIFNLGLSRFSGFKKMIAAIEQGNFIEAANQGLDSLWAKQVKSRATRLMGSLEKG